MYRCFKFPILECIRGNDNMWKFASSQEVICHFVPAFKNRIPLYRYFGSSERPPFLVRFFPIRQLVSRSIGLGYPASFGNTLREMLICCCLRAANELICHQVYHIFNRIPLYRHFDSSEHPPYLVRFLRSTTGQPLDRLLLKYIPRNESDSIQIRNTPTIFDISWALWRPYIPCIVNPHDVII